MDHPQTMPLRKKTYQSLMPLSITIILPLTNHPEPLILLQSSPLRVILAAGNR